MIRKYVRSIIAFIVVLTLISGGINGLNQVNTITNTGNYPKMISA